MLTLGTKFEKLERMDIFLAKFKLIKSMKRYKVWVDQWSWNKLKSLFNINNLKKQHTFMNLDI